MILKTFFSSYEGNEPIEQKLVHLNKKCPLYRMTEPKCFRDAFRDHLPRLSGQPNNSFLRGIHVILEEKSHAKQSMILFLRNFSMRKIKKTSI